MTKTAIILIGAPAAGKSTLAKTFTDNGYVLCSTDEIRLRLFGDYDEQGGFSLVEQEVINILSSIEDGGKVVIDATHFKIRYRRGTNERLIKMGFNIRIGLYLERSIEYCYEKNKSRDRRVPINVIDRMHKNLTLNKPNVDEGFTRVFTFANTEDFSTSFGYLKA